MNTTSMLLVLVAAALGTAAGLQQGRWELSHYEFDLARARREPEEHPGPRQLVTDNFHKDQRARRRWAWPTLLGALACLALALYLLVAGTDNATDLVLLAGVSLLAPWLGITGCRCWRWTGDGPHALTWPDPSHPPS